MGIISPKKPGTLSKTLIGFIFLILSPILLVPVLFYFLWGAILCIAAWLTWKKQFVIFVYSDSPIWKGYIEKEILPYIQDRAVILNWSERRKWKNSLPVLAFKYFGGYRNFNPMGMVFRPFRLVKTYRFFKAFREFKYGNTQSIEGIKREFFATIGI